MYVAVSGNIGSGKTTWTLRLAEGLGVRAVPEQPELNPWFATSGSTALEELRFLVSSAQDVIALTSAHSGGIVERVPAEHLSIFAHMKHDLRRLSDDELALIEDVHAVLGPLMPRPDVLLLLEAPCEELLSRVRARARSGEESIDLETLIGLQTRYDHFIGSWTECPVVRLDTSLNHPDRPADVAQAVDALREAAA